MIRRLKPLLYWFCCQFLSLPRDCPTFLRIRYGKIWGVMGGICRHNLSFCWATILLPHNICENTLSWLLTGSCHTPAHYDCFNLLFLFVCSFLFHVSILWCLVLARNRQHMYSVQCFVVLWLPSIVPCSNSLNTCKVPATFFKTFQQKFLPFAFFYLVLVCTSPACCWRSTYRWEYGWSEWRSMSKTMCDFMF